MPYTLATIQLGVQDYIILHYNSARYNKIVILSVSEQYESARAHIAHSLTDNYYLHDIVIGTMSYYMHYHIIP